MHIQKVQQVVLRERVVIVLVVFLIAQVRQPPLLYMLPIDVSSKMRILVTLTSSSNLLSGLKAYLTQSISSYRLCLKREVLSFQVFITKRRDSIRKLKLSLVSLTAAITTVSHLQALTLSATLVPTARNLGVIQQARPARGFYISH